MNRPTFVSLLTPPGLGALATIGVRGPNAWRFTNACLTKPIETDSAAIRPWLREFRSVEGAVEELVVVFSGVEEARIHCHGGMAACEAVVRALEAQGAIRRDSNDVEPKAIRNALSHALTERTALILLDQLHGALAKEIATIDELLASAQLVLAEQRLDQLLARVPIGLHLTEPWLVVIAGRPNAGKSSLLNALLGFERSITSPQPGTTRDVVTARTAIDGWPIELRDTAGLRLSHDAVEAAGVEMAEQEVRGADLVVYVIPADESEHEAHSEIAAIRQARGGNGPLLVVCTKADICTPNFAAHVAVSVWQNHGLEAFCAAMVARLIEATPEADAAVPFERAQSARLQDALQFLRARNTAAARERLNQIASPASVEA